MVSRASLAFCNLMMGSWVFLLVELITCFVWRSSTYVVRPMSTACFDMGSSVARRCSLLVATIFSHSCTGGWKASIKDTGPPWSPTMPPTPSFIHIFRSGHSSSMHACSWRCFKRCASLGLQFFLALLLRVLCGVHRKALVMSWKTLTCEYPAFLSFSLAMNATMIASSLECPARHPCAKCGMFFQALFSLNMGVKNSLPKVQSPKISLIAAGPTHPLFFASWYPTAWFQIMGTRAHLRIQKNILVSTCLNSLAIGCSPFAPTPNRSLAVFVLSGSISMARISTGIDHEGTDFLNLICLRALTILL